MVNIYIEYLIKMEANCRSQKYHVRPSIVQKLKKMFIPFVSNKQIKAFTKYSNITNVERMSE